MTRTAIIEAVPDCHLPFHWPRLDKSQELCVRLPEVESCLWSGGIPINEPQSLYINIRLVKNLTPFSQISKFNFSSLF